MSCPLNSLELEEMRDAEVGLFADAVTLRNPGTPTRGAAGGIVASAAVDTSATSRLEQLGYQTGSVREVADRLQLVNPYVWVFDYDQTGVTTATQIIFGTRTFLVRAVMKLGAAGVVTRAICDEVTSNA